jgi:hypothetical protein
MARRRTVELIPGDVVLTRKVFDNFVQPTPPNASGTRRTVEDIGIQPRDRVAEPDRIVFFTDGTQSHVRQIDWWTVKEVNA